MDGDGNIDTTAEMDTCIGIEIPGVGMRELGIAIPGVEEPDIKTPGWKNLDLDVDLDLKSDTKSPGVNIEMPPEANDPVKTTGVA